MVYKELKNVYLHNYDTLIILAEENEPLPDGHDCTQNDCRDFPIQNKHIIHRIPFSSKHSNSFLLSRMFNQDVMSRIYYTNRYINEMCSLFSKYDNILESADISMKDDYFKDYERFVKYGYELPSAYEDLFEEEFDLVSITFNDLDTSVSVDSLCIYDKTKYFSITYNIVDLLPDNVTVYYPYSIFDDNSIISILDNKLSQMTKYLKDFYTYNFSIKSFNILNEFKRLLNNDESKIFELLEHFLRHTSSLDNTNKGKIITEIHDYLYKTK